MASTTGPLLIESFAESFNRNLPTIDRNFYQFARQENAVFAKRETGVTRWTNERQGFGSLPRPRRNRDNEPLPQISPVKGYKTVIRIDTYRSQITAEESLIRTAEHKAVYENAQDALQAGVTLMDATTVDFFNNGFTDGLSTNIVEADGTARAFFSTGHLYEDNSGIWTNHYSVGVPPTPEVVWLIIQQYLGRLKDYGNVNFLNLGTEFTIITPSANPAYGFAAAEIVRSMDRPDTANRATNVLIGGGITIRHEIANWLTSTTKWFIRVDTGHRAYPLVLLEMEAGNLTPLTSIGAANPDIYCSRYRVQFGVGFDKSYRGVVAIGN